MVDATQTQPDDLATARALSTDNAAPHAKPDALATPRAPPTAHASPQAQTDASETPQAPPSAHASPQAIPTVHASPQVQSIAAAPAHAFPEAPASTPLPKTPTAFLHSKGGRLVVSTGDSSPLSATPARTPQSFVSKQVQAMKKKNSGSPVPKKKFGRKSTSRGSFSTQGLRQSSLDSFMRASKSLETENGKKENEEH